MYTPHREDGYMLQVIARIRNDFPTKFGLPRQSGLIDTIRSEIVFEPAYRNPDALRGLEGYTHIWLIWGFSGMQRSEWSPTVRPPRLGGNRRMGVFATRSPNRPNPLGLSCVQLERITEPGLQGVTLIVNGADLMDDTPIYDIKPYLPYADSHPQAAAGFTETRPFQALDVVFPPRWLGMVPPALQPTLCQVLAGDPRPAYLKDPSRVYGFAYAGLNVRFTVSQGTLTVVEITMLP